MSRALRRGSSSRSRSSSPFGWSRDQTAASRQVGWYVNEFGLGDDWSASEPGSVASRLVLVPVGRLDLRAVRAVERAWRIPAGERRAVHVVTDEAAAQDLASAWAERGWSFPLWFVEAGGDIATTVARVVRFELAAGFEEVVVLVGRLGLQRRFDRLVHHRTADAIGRQVQRIPAAQVGLLTVASV